MGIKVGLITGEYPPMEGGVGSFTQQLAKALAELDCDPWIITRRLARPDDVPRNVAFNEPVDLGFATLLPWATSWRRGDSQMVAEAIERYQLDLVNIQYQAAAFNMRNPRINFLPWRLGGLSKSVVTFHDLRTPYLFPKAGRLRERMVSLMAKQADAVIATNSADYRQLADLGLRSLAQIPIGSNIPAYPVSAEQSAEIRQSIDLPPDAILLAYFGFLNESKGAMTLVDALASLPAHFHLVFIGGHAGASDPHNNNDYTKLLAAQIDSHQLAQRVHWTGFVADELVSQWLVSADMIVLPYRDGVSLRRGTLMAALAHGRPIVTTPAQGDEPLLDANCLAFSPADDPERLAETIRQLAADPAKRARLAANAKQLAQAFEWATIAERTLALYREVLAS